MKWRRLIGLVVFVALLAAGVAWREQVLAFGRDAYAALASMAAGPGSAAPMIASGAIEAHTVAVGAQTGGRLATLAVAEGDQVTAGELIATLDTSLLEAQVGQAQAALAEAQAEVALLKAGARPADVAVARVALQQAEAGRDAAAVAQTDAAALVDAPGELNVQIAAATSAVNVADLQLQAARANATAADLEEGLWARSVSDLKQGFDVRLPLPGQPLFHKDAPPEILSQAQLQWNLASQKQWQAHSQVGVATAGLAAARQALSDLKAQKAAPQALQAAANAAAAAYGIAAAGVPLAQANLDMVQSGARPEQIQAAEALASKAEGALQAAQAQMGQMRVSAPSPGIVTSVVQRPGEVVAAGAPIVQLADLSQVELAVYVPEPDLGRVQLGQAVAVRVDSFPGRDYPGRVTYISDQAEFTPKNVETRDERASTVFEVKLTLANPDGTLKPGMPADATFCPSGTTNCAGGSSSTTTTASGQVSLPAPLANLLGGSGAAAGTAGPIAASGTIAGVQIDIAAELSGQVSDIAAQGSQVGAGQVVVRLENSDLAPAYRQALDAVAAAQANLANVTAAPQAARVAQAQAQVAQAEAGLLAARSALSDAVTLRDNPQDLDAQINATRQQVQTATAQIDLAKANLKAAQVLQASLPEGTGSDQDKTQRAMYDQQVAAASLALQAVQAQAGGAAAALNQLLLIRKQPLALEAAVHYAEGQVAVAQAALETARAALAQVQAPAQPEAVALAEAQVSQAEAGARLLEATMAKLEIQSPISGTVTSQAVHAGEVARPGVALLSVVDLRRVKLTIYVPENQIGRVTLGQAAAVSVDAYPGQTFDGVVTHINDQAEFTPKNVQTQEERVKMVFGVEISLDNADGRLKPGMPADAVLQ